MCRTYFKHENTNNHNIITCHIFIDKNFSFYHVFRKYVMVSYFKGYISIELSIIRPNIVWKSKYGVCNAVRFKKSSDMWMGGWMDMRWVCFFPILTHFDHIVHSTHRFWYHIRVDLIQFCRYMVLKVLLTVWHVQNKEKRQKVADMRVMIFMWKYWHHLVFVLVVWLYCACTLTL